MLVQNWFEEGWPKLVTVSRMHHGMVAIYTQAYCKKGHVWHVLSELCSTLREELDKFGMFARSAEVGTHDHNPLVEGSMDQFWWNKWVIILYRFVYRDIYIIFYLFVFGCYMVWFQPHAGSLMPGIYRRANAHLFTCGEQETRNTVLKETWKCVSFTSKIGKLTESVIKHRET